MHLIRLSLAREDSFLKGERTMRLIKQIISVTGVCTMAVGLAFAQDKPDNTKMNKGDGSKNAVTADKQTTNVSDRQLTQQVRKAVVADKGLSTYAHNVKI